MMSATIDLILPGFNALPIHNVVIYLNLSVYVVGMSGGNRVSFVESSRCRLLRRPECDS